jgi:hypothetical protein
MTLEYPRMVPAPPATIEMSADASSDRVLATQWPGSCIRTARPNHVVNVSTHTTIRDTGALSCRTKQFTGLGGDAPELVITDIQHL